MWEYGIGFLLVTQLICAAPAEDSSALSPEPFTLIKSVGGYGSNKGLFSSPKGITGDGENLFICDSLNNRIVKTDKNLTHFDYFQALPELEFPLDHPSNLILQNNQTLLVTDSHNHRVVHYTYEGTFINQIGTLGILAGTFDHPLGIAQDTTKKVYICDSQNNRIQIFTQEGVFLSEFGRSGNQEETLLTPTSLVVLDDGNILVSDTGHHVLKLYNGFGTYLRTLFQNSPDIKTPQSLCLDPQGYVYVADPEGHQVLFINPKLETILGRITAPLISPAGIFPDFLPQQQN